jgi:predicted MFS family arabinose efflux permease
MLVPNVAVIFIGLVVCACSGFICQAVSTGYVVTTAKEGRSSAAGLYASTFYLGGSAGAFLIGLVWSGAGWTGCVAAIVAVQAVMATTVALAWEGSRI